MTKDHFAGGDEEAKKPKKIRRRPRGVSAPGSRKDHVVLPSPVEKQYGGPRLLDSQSDLTPEDIYDGLIADCTSSAWSAGGERGVDYPEKKADIPLLLARDIHNFMRRLQSTRSSAYMVEHKSVSRPTALGLTMRSLADRLKASVPKDVEHHSEHVKLFVEAYVLFGLDGSKPDLDIVREYANGVKRDEFLFEGLFKYIRVKMLDASNPFKRRDAITGAPIFNPVGLAIKDTFRRRQKARRQRAYHNYKASCDLVNDIFRREPAVHVVRLDVGIMPVFWFSLADKEKVPPEKAFKKRLQSLFRAINRNTGAMSGVVGRIARLRWSPERGIYCHLILFYACNRKLKLQGIEKRIGGYWVDSVTRGVGVYSEMVAKSSRYSARPSGKIGRFDQEKRVELLQALRYLTSLDEYLGLDLPKKSDVFFLSEVAIMTPEKTGEKRKPGRPRINPEPKYRGRTLASYV